MFRLLITSAAFLIALTAYSCGQKPGEQVEQKDPLHGTWVGKSLFGEDMKLVFSPGGRIAVHNGNHVNEGTYKVDYSFNPAHIDIELSDRPKLASIIQFLDANTIAYELVNSSDGRPASFGQGRVTFQRITE